jgi:alpha-L-fucosidase
VDRSVGGKYENYRTPEQELPEKPLGYPWETCMTMATSWSYVPNDTYKSTGTIIHNLVRIISRGGNYLLNIGPGPDGEWDAVAYQRLLEIGAWMKINSEAVYDTKPIAPYQSGDVYFVTKSSGETYAIFLVDEKAAEIPEIISWKGLAPKDPRAVRLLGSKHPIICMVDNGITHVRIPEERRAPMRRYALVFEFNNK